MLPFLASDSTYSAYLGVGGGPHWTAPGESSLAPTAFGDMGDAVRDLAQGGILGSAHGAVFAALALLETVTNPHLRGILRGESIGDFSFLGECFG